MAGLDRWEILLLCVAGYIAITSLVRLMVTRRDQLVADVQQQIDARRERRKRKQK